MMRKVPALLLALFLFSDRAEAKLNVVATIPDLAGLARAVGGEAVSVESIAKGTQDPHFIEAKPSYMVKVSKADLIVAVGLDLEAGWVALLQQGARNPKVNKGEKGFLEIGPLLDPLEVAKGKVTRAEGDVHPSGNPHFWLDPIRLGKAAVLLAGRLGEIDPSHKELFAKNAAEFSARMEAKTLEWKTRVEKSGVKKAVTYHPTLSYFFARFGISCPIYLEPKPGIPPTSGHLINVISVMKKEKVQLLMVENFFDESVTKKITGEVPGSRAVAVPVMVGGEEKITSSEELIERLVAAVEGK